MTFIFSHPSMSYVADDLKINYDTIRLFSLILYILKKVISSLFLQIYFIIYKQYV